MASTKVRIRFEGNTLECRSGTSVAVALWENGVRHLSHSPKYGRPRGLTCARGHCTACLMRIDGTPNVRTCETAVRDGMEVARQDAGAPYAAPMQKILSAGSSLFPVGFYYKWFTRPPFLSRLFLDGIRPMTGVGRLPVGDPPSPGTAAADGSPPGPEAPAGDLGDFDTVVVGAGPSGLEAAAAASGRVLLLDDHAEWGGQRRGALRAVAAGEGSLLDRFGGLKSALERIETAREELAARGDVTFLERSRAIAGYHPGSLLVRRDELLQSVRFGTLVWAAGALDTLGLFPGNDTPGVIGPRALYRLLVRDGLRVGGAEVLVIGGGFDFWLSAALLATMGAKVSLVVTAGDSTAGTEETGPGDISSAAALGWPLATGLELEEITERGPGRLQVSFVPGSRAGGGAGTRLSQQADLAVLCGRGKPAYDIPHQLGAELVLQTGIGGFTPPVGTEAGPGPAVAVLPGGARLDTVGEARGGLPGRPRNKSGEGAD